MRKTIASIWYACSLLVTTATVINLARHGFAIELHSIPREIFHSYEEVRNKIFGGFEDVLLSWWTDFRISASLKDAVSFYLFFGVVLKAAQSVGVLAFIFKYVLRGGTLKSEDGDFTFLHNLSTVLFWPYGLWKKIVGWVRYLDQKVSTKIPPAAQRQARRMQQKIMIAGLLTYPVTLFVTFACAAVFFFWDFLQK
jgi:hypothetical protein